MAVVADISQDEIQPIAVGEHLRLGGDNMDIARARLVEQRLTSGNRLDAHRCHSLSHLCRMAKEDMFADAKQDSVAIALSGCGSAAAGGTLKNKLERQEVGKASFSMVSFRILQQEPSLDGERGSGCRKLFAACQ